MFILAIIVLASVGCQKEDEQDFHIDAQVKRGFRVSMVDQSHIRKNKKLFSRLNKMDKRHENSSSQKDVYDPEHGFTINTDRVKYIEEGNGYHSYTFPILRDVDNGLLENLVFSLQEDGTYDSFIITYDLTIDQQNNLLAGLEVDLEGKVTKTMVDDLGLPTDLMGKVDANCVDVVMQSCSYGNHPGGLLPNGDFCPGYEYDRKTVCPGGGGPLDNNGGDPTDTNTDTDTSSGHVETGGTGSGGTTSPTCTRNCIDEACNPTLTGSLANLSLSDAEICWINASAQDDFKDEVGVYLTLGGDPNFAEVAIQEAKNGSDVDFQEKVISKLTGKAECIYNKLKIQNSVRRILNKFQENNSPANLIIELASLGNAFGNTTPPDASDLITVQLNNDSSVWGVDYQPNALVAQTLFHEIIHAEFYREIIKAIGSGNYSGATHDEVVAALENSNHYYLYKHYKQLNDWSHNFMANYFRDTIARATQEYATGIAVPDDVEPEALYMNLAWRGLRNDDEIIAWDNLTDEQKNLIDEVINAFTLENTNQICTE